MNTTLTLEAVSTDASLFDTLEAILKREPESTYATYNSAMHGARIIKLDKHNGYVEVETSIPEINDTDYKVVLSLGMYGLNAAVEKSS